MKIKFKKYNDYLASIMIKTKGLKKFILRVLVIIFGVLSAFLIERYENSLSENKKEKIFLSSLKENLKEDFIELDSVIIQIEKKLRQFSFINDKVEDSVQFRQILSVRTSDTRTDTYTSLIQSGNIELISNFDLNKKIVKFYSTIPNQTTFINRWELEYYKDNIYKKLYQLDFNKKIPLKDLKNLFSEDFYILELINNNKLQNYIEAKNKSKLLINEIESELNK